MQIWLTTINQHHNISHTGHQNTLHIAKNIQYEEEMKKQKQKLLTLNETNNEQSFPSKTKYSKLNTDY